MLGEGIIPSLICCDIFLEGPDASSTKGFDFEQVQKKGAQEVRLL